ncbi:MAG: hypothetical protein SGI89_15305 [bacterium]|nr:hypothetical protein [bacterium]
MINLQLAIILGTDLWQIRSGIESFESMHLGLFINSLRYKDEKEGRKLKSDFISSATQSIKFINNEIHKFNIFIKYFKKSGVSLTPIEKINISAVKKIVLAHQGHHPQAEGAGAFVHEIMGKGNSPSVLARKHTSLQIKNIILRTKLSLSDFVKSINRFLEIFDSIDRANLRPHIQNEIEKAKTAYSVGLPGESIFILGRLLENLVTEYILFLKKTGKVSLTKDQILTLGFHKKVEFLHNKSLPVLSNSQFSKLMSVKWDRNTYGHKINSKGKDYQAIIAIGLVAIDFFDKKIAKLKGKSKI